MSNSENTITIEVAAATAPEATAKATRAPHSARVALPKAGSKKKATSSKKAPKSQKVSKPAKAPRTPKTAKKQSGPQTGSETEAIMALLTRPDGATLQDLMKATSWQPHSVRRIFVGSGRQKDGFGRCFCKARERRAPLLGEGLTP